MLRVPNSVYQPDRPAYAVRGPAGQPYAVAPVCRPRPRTTWLSGVQPELPPGASTKLRPCLCGQVFGDSEVHHRHPGGRLPSSRLEPGTNACTGRFFLGIPHPEETVGTGTFVVGPVQSPSAPLGFSVMRCPTQ